MGLDTPIFLLKYLEGVLMKKLFIAFICISLLFSGCASKNIKNMDGKVYLEKGLKYYNAKKYRKAAENLEKAIKYADSPSLAAKAQLYLGNAYFKDKNYLEAIPSYKQFLDYYPDAVEAPEVLFKLGLSYYKEVSTFDREQQTTIDAIETFKKLKSQFPKYAEEKNVDKYINRLTEELAKKELYVAEFYFRTNKKKAAESRLKYIIEHYENTKTYKKALIKYCKYLSEDESRRQEALMFLNKLLNISSENETYAEDINEILKKLKNI
jgi:outer membrane protein assembly factor BamD